MGRTALVTVPDEGSAWVVRDALAAGGVACQVERVGMENPYMANALARQMRVFVANEQLPEARRLLAALEGELANHADELTEEALAAARPDEEPAPAPAEWRPRVSAALALGLLVPIPLVCLYARISWLGLLFLVLFLASLANIPELRFLESVAELEWPLSVTGLTTKLGDLIVGVVVVARRRAAAS
jgi:hypothetical protein